MEIICGFCKGKGRWMIEGTEPTCEDHLIRALDHYDKVEIERITK